MVYKKRLKGFPFFYANGTYKKKKKFIVISRHGFDLHTIHKIRGSKFSYKTVFNIGIEIVTSIQGFNLNYRFKDWRFCIN
jgi:hypothetical protein